MQLTSVTPEDAVEPYIPTNLLDQRTVQPAPWNAPQSFPVHQHNKSSLSPSRSAFLTSEAPEPRGTAIEERSVARDGGRLSQQGEDTVRPNALHDGSLYHLALSQPADTANPIDSEGHVEESNRREEDASVQLRQEDLSSVDDSWRDLFGGDAFDL